eukprot:1372213-Amorphochlora_amoeboformis.AAC.2
MAPIRNQACLSRRVTKRPIRNPYRNPTDTGPGPDGVRSMLPTGKYQERERKKESRMREESEKRERDKSE